MPLIVTDTMKAEISGPAGDLTVSFRNPTNDEITKYNAATAKANHGSQKWWDLKSKARLALGKKVITGFDDYVHIMKGGRDIKFASDPDSKHYDENWRNLFAIHLPRYLEGLATHLADRILVEEERGDDDEVFPDTDDDIEKN